jgi:hypothetical protein
METVFNQRSPHLLIVDNFYKDPDSIVHLAEQQKYKPQLKYYKGVRTEERFLFPYVREEFQRLLRLEITDWLNQPMNGIFQKTSKDDPLVWHSDSQDYAAAIYLTKDAPVSMGTSFWRDTKFGCRRPPSHPLEGKAIADAEVYTEYNLLHKDNWQLVDKVGAVYNRLAIWDAKLIHSASEYGSMDRLVQLFFFSTKR